MDSKLTDTNSVNEFIPDPISEAIVEAKRTSFEDNENIMREGVFIIFHGAPNTSNLKNIVY